MNQWNSSYYRKKNYSRVIKGSIDSIINGIATLPVEAEICHAFLESKNKRNDSITDLSKFIALSPSLTFNILSLVHSPFYNGNKNITSLNDALKIIGTDIAPHLIKDLFLHRGNSGEGLDTETSINSHYYGALKSAHLSALLSEELKFSSQFTAYVAALIHNVGSVALSIRFPTQYNRLKKSGDFSYLNQASAEDHALGTNHCFLGARMVEHWGSFPFIADAIFYHHHSLKKIKQASNLVRLIYFSSMVADLEDTDPSQIKETGKELFNFTESQIDEYISIAELKVQNRLMHLGIEVTDNITTASYQPDYQREMIDYDRDDKNSLVSVLINNIRNLADKKNILNQIGIFLHILTGFNQIYYFKYNEAGNSLDGISLRHPENKEFSNDFSLPISLNSSLIVTSFLMGMDINSLERVNNAEPALFDLQLINYMETEGIYCLPLLDKEKTIGLFVFGVNSAGSTFYRDNFIKLRFFTEAIIPLLSNNKRNSNVDLSGNKNSETGLMQTRKLIHEINNPLSAVKNYLKVLSMKLDDINVETGEIRIIDDELNRITKLLKEFKSSSAEIKVAKSTSGIRSIISDTILLIKNSRVNGPAVNIDFEMDENIPDIMIDKDAFRQVLINLINNSIEAMPQGGNISVSVHYRYGLGRGKRHTVNPEDDGQRIEISIADNGPGVPDKLKPNLFKNQSTTKSDHDGLGLLIVHELVKKMGGNVILDDDVNKGACFRIELPAS